MPYSALEPEKIKSTAHELALRVAERFPNNGIAQVSRALAELSEKHTAYAAKAASRNWPMQIVSVLIVLAGWRRRAGASGRCSSCSAWTPGRSGACRAWIRS